jgi:hypothetical protein
MSIKKIAISLFILSLVLACTVLVAAQDAPSPSSTAQPTPDSQQQQEEKLKLESKASALLEQVVTEAQALKLPENRIRVQIAAGDLLWDKSAARARGLFADAAAIFGQMMLDVDRTDRDEMQTLNQLRQDLVLTAGRHDAELGYQLLRSTQPPTDNNTVNGRRFAPPSQNSLEQSLLATIATTDPKVAYQKATESLDKGEYPSSLNKVLAQLQSKDEDAFKKLSDKALSKLNSDALLANRNADNVAIGLLTPGPRPASTSTSTANATKTSNSQSTPPQVLSESAFHDLMDSAVTAALSVTSLGGNNNFAGGGRGMRAVQQNQQNPPDDAQVRQNNARMMLFALQTMLPQIDQYLPERASAVRQKMTELGMGNNTNTNFGSQMRTAMQQGTSDSLATAASTAPPQMQSRLYQQAAQKAVDEGNTDRALQIATDHLDESGRNSIMQAVDFKKMATTVSPEKMNEIRQKLAALPSDSDRVKYLIDLSTATQKDNPKLALRFLEDARNLVNKRAASYKEFEDQIKVADAFAPIDSKRSFELLETGIAQLNELLSAAAVLNGFEVEIFKEGELSLKSDSDLISMVSRYGEELASLAKVDFEHARMSADRFQLAEPRLNAKLFIVQSILGTTPPAVNNNRRNQNNFQFVMR